MAITSPQPNGTLRSIGLGFVFALIAGAVSYGVALGSQLAGLQNVMVRATENHTAIQKNADRIGKVEQWLGSINGKLDTLVTLARERE